MRIFPFGMGTRLRLYLKMINPEANQEERDEIKKDLLTYCGHDTLALVKIWERLLRKRG